MVLLPKNTSVLRAKYIANYAEEKANNAKADNDLSKKFNTALTYYDQHFPKRCNGKQLR